MAYSIKYIYFNILYSIVVYNPDMICVVSFMHKALDGDIRRQDFRSVIVGVARNPNGRALAWNFLRAEWDRVFEMCV